MGPMGHQSAITRHLPLSLCRVYSSESEFNIYVVKPQHRLTDEEWKGRLSLAGNIARKC